MTRAFLEITTPGRIGHLALETDWYLKRVAMGEVPEHEHYIAIRRSKLANPYLIELFSQRVNMAVDEPAYTWWRKIRRLPGTRVDMSSCAQILEGAADCYRVLSAWGDRPPLWELPTETEARGRETLRKMGLPDGAWFVAVHAREGGYSPGDEHRHSYRNQDVNTLALSIQEITARGGWVVRMGDATMQPLPPMEGCIDYALSDFKTPEMDVFLCANCRFFLGNSSGIYTVASIFNRPSALVNMAPFGAGLGLAGRDISIPKIAMRDGKDLPFAEVMGSDISSFRLSEQFDEARVTLRENSAEEIRDLTLEMLARFEDDVPAVSEEDAARQAVMRSLFQPHHYAYHSSATIGRAFLRDYAALL